MDFDAGKLMLNIVFPNVNIDWKKWKKKSVEGLFTRLIVIIACYWHFIAEGFIFLILFIYFLSQKDFMNYLVGVRRSNEVKWHPRTGQSGGEYLGLRLLFHFFFLCVCVDMANFQ